MRHPKTPVSTNDPNVEEIRAIRAELSAQFGDDIGRLGEHLRQIEEQYRDRIVLAGKRTGRTPRRAASGKRA